MRRVNKTNDRPLLHLLYDVDRKVVHMKQLIVYGWQRVHVIVSQHQILVIVTIKCKMKKFLMGIELNYVMCAYEVEIDLNLQFN